MDQFINTEREDNELFRYYNLYAEEWDSESSIDFFDLNEAIKYAINSDGWFGNYVLSVNIFTKGKEAGQIEKKEVSLYELPNQKKKEVKFIILGLAIDDEPKIIESYAGALGVNPDNPNFLSRAEKYVDIYELTVSLGENNKLNFKYDLIKKLEKGKTK